MTHCILTCAEVRACEARAEASGLSLWTLMQRAGLACADTLMRLYPSGRVIVLAGPGNNGGDAFVAAQRLAESGREVVLHELPPAGSRSPEGANASNGWTSPRRALAELRIEPGDVVLDGLFGAGLSRPLEGEAAAAVDRVNQSGAFVVAIDVPSGVRGDTGAVAEPSVRASVTVTFDARKPAHLLQPAEGQCGEVVVANIGLGPYVDQASPVPLLENAPPLWRDAYPWPHAAGHKHGRGRLVVVSGGVSNTGAARLAAQAGLRAGAGLVTLLCPPAALVVAASQLTAVMVRAFADEAALADLSRGAHAAILGPAAGVTPATLANIKALSRTGTSLVLDADALTVLAQSPADLQEVAAAGPVVLTPHAGEFERLFPGVLAGAASKVEAVREAAKSAGCVVLLKGADTVISEASGRAVINVHATPFLATAGAGDVLAGIIGGLLAQGMSPFDAACAGAWMHGDAGRKAGPGMTAEDLDPALKEVIAGLWRDRHKVVMHTGQKRP